jgi:uncharacterized protein (TIGR02118 family)
MGGIQMFKVIYLNKRRRGMTHEQFMQYLNEKHAKLAKKIPGLIKYVSNEIIHESKGLGGAAQSEPEWDSVSELWYESKQAMEEGYASPAGRENFADSPNFIDPDGLVNFHVIEKDM